MKISAKYFGGAVGPYAQ